IPSPPHPSPTMILFSLCNGSILWLATCISSLSADSQNLILAKVGSSVVLPCHWKNVSTLSPHVEWCTFTETVFERKGEEQYQGEGYQDRVDVPKEKLKDGDCSLVLKNIRPADEGVYESYLLVKRGKRSLSSKRAFLQSVELWVDETPEKRNENYNENTVTDDARMNYPPLKIILLLPLWLLLY
ncbi:hypothetical protein NFI96_032398, partial [Prochilodus magdalenae]